DRHLFLEVHHIIHWLDGGPTDTWNLVALCPHHHRLHHHGRLGITGNADDPDGIEFSFAAGDRIHASGARPEPPGAPPPQPAGTYQHPFGERLESRWLYFNPPPRHHN
ncbi:MAG: HNH endonuclease, partial [Ilumatobacter sp.]|nr:HNH endonuclease [Ilumatobacter sp.]